jgi:hypothetical protein
MNINVLEIMNTGAIYFDIFGHRLNSFANQKGMNFVGCFV